MMSNIDMIAATCERVYLACIDCINNTGKCPIPLLVYHFSKLIFHIQQKSVLPDYLEEFNKTVVDYMPSYASTSFVRFGTFFNDLLLNLNHYSKHLVFDDVEKPVSIEKLPETNQL